MAEAFKRKLGSDCTDTASDNVLLMRVRYNMYLIHLLECPYEIE